MKKTERNKNILKLRLAGQTYQEIGETYGISKIRVRQIVILESKKQEGLRQ